MSVHISVSICLHRRAGSWDLLEVRVKVSAQVWPRDRPKLGRLRLTQVSLEERRKLNSKVAAEMDCWDSGFYTAHATRTWQQRMMYMAQCCEETEARN